MNELDYQNRTVPDKKVDKVKPVEPVNTGDASSALVGELGARLDSTDKLDTLETIAQEIKNETVKGNITKSTIDINSVSEAELSEVIKKLGNIDEIKNTTKAYELIKKIKEIRLQFNYNQLYYIFTTNVNMAKAFINSIDELGEIDCFNKLDEKQKINLVQAIVNTYPEGYDEDFENGIKDQGEWGQQIKKPTDFKPSKIEEEVTINSQIKNLIEEIKSTKGLDITMIKAIVTKLHVDGRKQSEYIKDIMDSAWFNKLDDGQQVYVAQAISFNDHGKLYTALGNYDNPIWKKIADKGGWKQAA